MSFIALVNHNLNIKVEEIIGREIFYPVLDAFFSKTGKFSAFKLSPLAHFAHLRTSEDNEYIAVGRIRLDRGGELREQLLRIFPQLPILCSDLELALHAYVAWGESAVDHIHGDFSIVFWDEGRETLFSARDRMGVRALAYVEQLSAMWLSDSLRHLTETSSFDTRRLDRRWITDFLQVGFSGDPSRTAFSNAKRLAPAHSLTVGPSAQRIRRYWHLEPDSPLFLRSSEEYLEIFQSLIEDSVRDRLPRNGAVGIQLSGGLDSSTLAATAVKIRGGPVDVVGRTWIVGGGKDPEGPFSRLVAGHLGIRHEVIESDRMHYNPQWRSDYLLQPEPQWSAVYPANRQEDVKAMAAVAAVWFYGEGPDNALSFEWQSYLRWLTRQKRWYRLGEAAVQYMASKSLSDWASSIYGRFNQSHFRTPMPAAVDWVRHQENAPHDVVPVSWRPRALRGLRGGQWPYFLEVLDVDHEASDIEWCHPFLEPRLLEFMVRTPPIPWGRRKSLIRRAMRGRLPAEILTRPKTPLHTDVIEKMLRENPPELPKKGSLTEEYIDINNMPIFSSKSVDTHALLRVSILDKWLNTRYGNS